MKPHTSYHIVYSIVFIFTMIALASCQQQSKEAVNIPGISPNPDHAADVELVLEVNQALLTGDSSLIASLLTSDFIAYGPEWDTRYNKETEIKSWIDFSNEFTNAVYYDKLFYSFITDEIEGRPELAGKWVFMWAHLDFQSGDEQKITVPVHIAYRIDNGLIQNTISYYDRLSISQQMGYSIIKNEE